MPTDELDGLVEGPVRPSLTIAERAHARPSHPRSSEEVAPAPRQNDGPNAGARGQAVSAPSSAEVSASRPQPRLVPQPPSSPLFRRAALRAYAEGEEVATALRVDALSTWTFVSLLSMIVLVGLSISVFGRVNINAEGRGILQTPNGVRNVTARLDGVVKHVLVENGDLVEEGQQLLSIDASGLEAQLLDAERQLEAWKARHAQEYQRTQKLQERSMRLLRRRTRIAGQRIVSQRARVARLQEKARTFDLLAEKGVTAESDRIDAEDAMESAEREGLALRDERTSSEVQLTGLERAEAQRDAERSQELAMAMAKRDAVARQLTQTVLKAPIAGRIEALTISAGEFVQPGMRVARLVPAGKPVRAVVFVPERERAFLRAGAMARLEVDRLPAGEFGTVQARVEQVSDYLATQEELQRMFGDESYRGPVVRVALELLVGGANDRLARQLASGSMVTARIPVRERRIISLVLDPLRKWLD
jgi:multidrug resistance efflux pump